MQDIVVGAPVLKDVTVHKGDITQGETRTGSLCLGHVPKLEHIALHGTCRVDDPTKKVCTLRKDDKIHVMSSLRATVSHQPGEQDYILTLFLRKTKVSGTFNDRIVKADGTFDSQPPSLFMLALQELKKKS